MQFPREVVLPRKRIRGLEAIQLICAAILLASIVALAGSDWAEFQRATAKSDRTIGSLSNLEAYLSLVKDAETGQRGYLLTGDREYLAPYRIALKEIPAKWREVAKDVDPKDSERLRTLTEAKLTELEQTVNARQRYGLANALLIVNTNKGHQNMVQIRQLIQQLTTQQQAVWTQQIRDEQARGKRTLLVAGTGSSLLFAFLCVSSLTIGRIADKREHVIEALRESRALKEEARSTFEATLKSIGDAVITTDAIGRIVFMNAVAEALTGWQSTAAAGKPLDEVFQIVNETTRAKVESPVDKVRRERAVVGLANHTILLQQGGNEVSIDDSGAPIIDRTGKMSGVVLVFRDIGERRRVERTLEESERRFRQLADALPQIVWTASPDGTIDYCNRRWHEFFGSKDDERAIACWDSLVDHTDAEIFYQSWKAAMHQLTPFEVECQMEEARTGRLKWFLGRAVPALDSAGKPVKWFGTFTDIDDRKKAEAALRHANEDLSQFAFSASHDLQEPLRNIIMFTQLFAKRNKGLIDAESDELIQTVVDSGRRMQALIRDLLLYVRAASETPNYSATADGNQALDKAIAHLQVFIRDTDAQIVRDPLPILQVESIHLQQLFQNLIGNALKYRSEAQPCIEIKAIAGEEDCLISVKDNGIGIAPEYSQQIFGLFKRLHGHSEYSGTGIGLAICQKIVERYGGKIWVESTPRQGSTFLFTLPRHL